MPGTEWKKSLKHPDQYEAIKKAEIAKGTPAKQAKTKAARISNSGGRRRK